MAADPGIPALPPADQPLRDFITRVEADGRITFRLFAPEAKAVSVVFGSMDPTKVKATPMMKGYHGVRTSPSARPRLISMSTISTSTASGPPTPARNAPKPQRQVNPAWSWCRAASSTSGRCRMATCGS